MGIKGIGEIGLDLAAAQDVAQSSRLDSALNNAKINANGPRHEEEIRKAGEQFEALLVQEMLKSMWSTVPKNTLFGDGREMELFNEMLQQEVAKNVAENQSLGIKDVIIQDIKAQEKRTAGAKAKANKDGSPDGIEPS